MLNENIRGAGWGFAVCWPLLVTGGEAWAEVVWLGGLGMLACLVLLVRGPRYDLEPCGGRCCVVEPKA